MEWDSLRRLSQGSFAKALQHRVKNEKDKDWPPFIKLRSSYLVLYYGLVAARKGRLWAIDYSLSIVLHSKYWEGNGIIVKEFITLRSLWKTAFVPAVTDTDFHVHSYEIAQVAANSQKSFAELYHAMYVPRKMWNSCALLSSFLD